MRVALVPAVLALGSCMLDREGMDGGPASAAPTGGAGGQGAVGGDGGASAEGGAGAAPAKPWLEPFARRKRITFHPPAISADVASIPLAVLLATDADLALAARDDGDDIAFTESDGTTKLSHEIDRFDGATGALVAWVRLAVLDSAADTDVFLYYGAPGASSNEDPAGTWAHPFAGVWHLSEDPSASPPQFRDSGPHDNHGSASPAQEVPSSFDGVAGKGLLFDGVDDRVAIGDPQNESLDFGTSSFSYGVWVHVVSSAGSYDMPWFKGGSSLGNLGWDMELGTQGWRVSISDGATVLDTTFGQEPQFLGKWTHLVAVLDRSAGLSRVYVNGAPTDTDDITTFGSVSTSHEASMGNSSYPFRGTLDEMRVYADAISADWIAVEHANLTDPSFMSVGPEEVP